MNKKQISFLTMAKGVLAHFNGNESAWVNLEVVKEVVGEIGTQVGLVDEPSQKQEGGTTGHTAIKDALFDTMIEKTFKLKLKLSAYARHKKDTLLLQSIDYSKSALEAGAEAGALVRCKFVLQHAKATLDKLGPYQVTQQELEEVESSVLAYEKAPVQRDLVGSTRKTATATIEQVVEELRDNFEMLDDFTYGMIDHPEFVSTYRNLRQVKERTGRTADVVEE